MTHGDARHDFVYLASQSPRRAQLLDQLGVRHELLLADGDEDAEALEAERARRSCRRPMSSASRAPSCAAARRRLAARAPAAAPILCADTTVALGTRILGKPVDADARARDAALRCRAARTAC